MRVTVLAGGATAERLVSFASAAQIVVRAGIPPGIPGFQAVTRSAGME